MYILLDEKNVVLEIIPDENPTFPGIPITDRYAPEFCNKLRHFSEDTEVEPNWIYDEDTAAFKLPPEPEPTPVTETPPTPQLEAEEPPNPIVAQLYEAYQRGVEEA